MARGRKRLGDEEIDLCLAVAKASPEIQACVSGEGMTPTQISAVCGVRRSLIEWTIERAMAKLLPRMIAAGVTREDLEAYAQARH